MIWYTVVPWVLCTVGVCSCWWPDRASPVIDKGYESLLYGMYSEKMYICESRAPLCWDLISLCGRMAGWRCLPFDQPAVFSNVGVQLFVCIQPLCQWQSDWRATQQYEGSRCCRINHNNLSAECIQTTKLTATGGIPWHGSVQLGHLQFGGLCDFWISIEFLLDPEDLLDVSAYIYCCLITVENHGGHSLCL